MWGLYALHRCTFLVSTEIECSNVKHWYYCAWVQDAFKKMHLKTYGVNEPKIFVAVGQLWMPTIAKDTDGSDKSNHLQGAMVKKKTRAFNPFAKFWLTFVRVAWCKLFILGMPWKSWLPKICHSGNMMSSPVQCHIRRLRMEPKFMEICNVKIWPGNQESLSSFFFCY